MRRAFSLLLSSLTVLVLLAACSSGTSPASTSSPLDNVTLRLNFPPYAADHAFYYFGVEKGFYKAAGINLDIEPGTGSATTLKLVASGSDPIGLVDASTLMHGVAQGIQVRAVMVINQTSPASIIYRQSHPIKTAADLKGKTIGVTQGDLFSQVFPAVLDKNGIKPQDVHVVSFGTAGAKETAVLQGQADGLLGFYTDQPLRMQAQTGTPMGWTTFSSLGINTLSLSIVMNNAWLNSHKDLATRFVSATQKAIAATIADPQAAANAFVKDAKSPYAFTPALALAEIQGTLPLLHTPNSLGKPIGWSAQADWDTTQSILAKYGGLPAANVNNYYTNELIGSGS